MELSYEQVLANAREKIGPNCRVCPECNGLGCKNTMPGPGSKAPGNGAYDNWLAWRNIKLNMDTIAPSDTADTSTEFLGRKLSLPLLSAPIGSIRLQFNPTDDVRDYNECAIAACREAGILATFGDGLSPDVLTDTIALGKKYGGDAIAVLNPYAVETILENMDLVNAAELFAVSVVIDSAGLPHLKKLNPNAGAKTVEELRVLRERAQMPFILKGIMTATGAEKAVEAGADAIIVSNHGGRVLPDTPATAEVLPEIVEAVGGKTTIIVDGGIRSGVDVFKALALGADAVMICRPFLISYYGGGKEGVACYIEKIRSELADTMYMCGARTVSEISRDMIRLPK